MKHTWRELIEKAKLDDQGAFSELYQNSYDAVYRTVKSMVKDDDAALDIVQDAFIKGFGSLSTLEEPENFLPWMKRIATNKAKDWFKKRHDINFSQLSDDEGNEPDFEDERPESLPEEVIDRDETARLIEEILGTLSDEQRLAVGMFYYQSMSVSEIADTLGISENTVKSRLNYGRKKIKAGVEELEKRGTKLYGLAPIPFLLWLFRNQIASPAEGGAPAAIFGNIMAGTAAESTAAATTASAAAAGNIGGGLLSTVGAKVTAGVLAAAIIGGVTGTAAYFARRGDDDADIPVIADTYSPPDEETETTAAPAMSGEAQTSAPAESDEPEATAPAESDEPETTAPTESDEPETTFSTAESVEPETSSPAESNETETSSPVTSAEPETTSPAASGGSETTSPAASGGSETTSPAVSGEPENEDPAADDGLIFTLSDEGNSYAVTGMESREITDLVIPTSYNGLPVTEIGNDVFAERFWLNSVTIPDSVTSIGNYAFYHCSGLTDITIPDGVTSIGRYSFYGCEGLANITIRGSVTNIGEGAFGSCTKLNNITLPGSVTSIEYGTFKGCTSLTDITIPDSVTTIENGAFSNCKSLTDITYTGTMEKCKAINGYSTAFSGVVIHCTDGDITE